MALIRLKRVVLPAPLGPAIPRISPSPTVNDTSATALSEPKDLVRALTSRRTAGDFKSSSPLAHPRWARRRGPIVARAGRFGGGRSVGAHPGRGEEGSLGDRGGR